MYNIKYTNDQKDVLQEELKEHQRNIGDGLIKRLQNVKNYMEVIMTHGIGIQI